MQWTPYTRAIGKSGAPLARSDSVSDQKNLHRLPSVRSGARKYCEGPLVVVKCLLFLKSSHKVAVYISVFTFYNTYYPECIFYSDTFDGDLKI